MEIAIVEVTNGGNWGKFLIGRMDAEWERESAVDAEAAARGMPLLRSIGWGADTIVVFDLQTREGAGFRPGGYAAADLDKRAVWVCPMFEPFLTWLYTQDLTDLRALPPRVDLPDAEFAFKGYRRAGGGEHPGAVLQRVLDDRGITQKRLAEEIGRNAQLVNDICRGKKGITAETALQITRVLGGDAEHWLWLQSAWELGKARRALSAPVG